MEPVPPEVGKQSQGAPDVEHDHEAEPVGLRLGLRNDQRVPAEKRGVNDRMAKARNREQLGNSLQNAEDYRLKVTDVQGRDARASGAGHEFGMGGQHVGV